MELKSLLHWRSKSFVTDTAEVRILLQEFEETVTQMTRE